MDPDIWGQSNDLEIEVEFRTKWPSEFVVSDGILPSIKILNSSIFLKAMADRIGVSKLITDPYYSGVGLNVTVRGDLLDKHIDVNYHDAT